MGDHPYNGGFGDVLSLDTEWLPGGIILYYADGDEEIIHVNRYVVDLFECDSVEDFMAYTKGTFKNVVYKDDVRAAEDSIWGQVSSHDGLDHIYYRIKTKSGRYVSIDDLGRLVEREGERPVFCAFIFEVSKSGGIDWLTGLPDMARFYSLARMGFDSIVERGERPAVVAFDLIGMKTYNARHGRAMGDVMLRIFGERLMSVFGSEACSRFGEDHFYAFAPEDGIAERIEGLFEDFRTSGVEGVLPVRAGVYACEPSDDIVLVGVDRAKIACDLDRNTWVSHITWYTDDMRAATRLRIHVLEHLDQAIAERWIRPYYQAVVRAATGVVCEEEALARWIDPQYGLLSPGLFIPVLEEAGLLHKVDMHMLDCVLADMHLKRAQGVGVVPMSINISLRDLGQLNVANEIITRVDAANVEHELIHIEFTESALTSDPELFRVQVDTLREAGFEVWMDDFGSGYSSLNTLQEYDFDVIKLDMGFIRSAHREKSRVIIAGLIQGAQRLGVGTLAEGVETKEQASFLEGIGCEMIQGFFYAMPRPLDDIVACVGKPGELRRESLDEAPYWNTLGMISLKELPTSDGGRADGMSPASEMPMGLMEWRNNQWRLIRANDSFAKFLAETGMLPSSRSDLVAQPLASLPDAEFFTAALRSRSSGRWERIMGRKEYGTGYQYSLRAVASTDGADAYLVVGSPTMLGSALGTFGDVPVGYAVFRVAFDSARTRVVGAEYVYANPLYCDWIGAEPGGIVGRSFAEVTINASDFWFDYCYRAVAKGENVHDIVYSPEVGHWLSCNVAPSPIEDCCVFAFTFADDEQRERSEVIMGRDTSDLIITIADALNGEKSYDTAMNNLLKTMNEVVHPERLYILERRGDRMRCSFEWRAEGLRLHYGALYDVSDEKWALWDEFLTQNPVVQIDDVDALRDSNPGICDFLRQRGVSRLLVFPFYNEGEPIGYLGASNFVLAEGLDTMRLLKTVASFVGSRVASHRFMEQLEYAGTHDTLTGLLDRRGIDLAIDAWLTAHRGEPFALALMDVDDFKAVNDMYGHDVGDEALRVLAAEVSQAFGRHALVGRNSGDEFLIMLTGDDVERADKLFEAFCARDLGFDYRGRHYGLSVSIGFAHYPTQVDSLLEAYSKADSALYAVKLAGKSGSRAYSPEVETAFRSQLGFSVRDIAENMPGAILVHKPGDNEILFANSEMVRLFECQSLEDFLAHTGGTFGGIIHPDDRERVREELEAQTDTVVSGLKDYVDFRIVTKRGNVRHVADNGRRMFVQGFGEVFYELVVNLDERVAR